MSEPFQVCDQNNTFCFYDAWKFGFIKQFDESWFTTVKDLESQRFNH